MKQIKFNNQTITPSKIVCVGRNYLEHINELNNETPKEPVVFNKPNSAIANKLLAGGQDEVHYEAELVFMIEQASLKGVAVGLDLTKRDIQSALKDSGLPWERAKAFDNSAVFSEFVNLPADVSTLSLKLFIDNKLTQEGSFSQMIYKPQVLLNNISEFMSFIDGDLLMTGTPKGVGLVENGSIFVAQVLAANEVLVSATWKAE